MPRPKGWAYRETLMANAAMGHGSGGVGYSTRVPARTQYRMGRDGALVKADVSCSDLDDYSSSPRACDDSSSELSSGAD